MPDRGATGLRAVPPRTVRQHLRPTFAVQFWTKASSGFFTRLAGLERRAAGHRSWRVERILASALETQSARRASYLHHALRRTCGRTAWKNGVPIETVSRVLGHADGRRTMRYLAIDQDTTAQPLELLGRVLRGTRIAEERGVRGPRRARSRRVGPRIRPSPRPEGTPGRPASRTGLSRSRRDRGPTRARPGASVGAPRAAPREREVAPLVDRRKEHRVP